MVLEKTDKTLPQQPANTIRDEDENEGMDDQPDETPVQVSRELTSFESFTVWGHDELAKAGEDVYIKGVEEWMALAKSVSTRTIVYVSADHGQMHSFDD